MHQPNVEHLLKEIGSKVRFYRKSITNNYETFADEHHLNKVTVSRIESGQNFTMTSLIQVLGAMNVSLEDFFRGIK